MTALPDRYLAHALRDASVRQLEPVWMPLPRPVTGEVLLRVSACGVCRTDLHLVDGELPGTVLPRVPGHEIVGRVVATGPGVADLAANERIGVPWLHDTCGACVLCRSGRENLCERARFTGWTVDGGYAQYALARRDFCFRIPPDYSDEEAAPLLCAGLIGYRALRLAGDARSVGIYGFGAAGHLVAQVALVQGRRVFAFTRTGDSSAQALALGLGVHWAGDSLQAPPEPMDAALLFAPVGELVPQSLQHLAPGGVVVCAGIHMSDIPSFPYRWLWRERVIRSVANLTRQDGLEFFDFAARHRLRLHTRRYALADANRALDDLRAGRVTGAAVLDCSAS